MPNTSSNVNTLSIEALRDAFILAERENSNLRRIILWAAQFIPHYRRHELAAKIKDKEHGVVEDAIEDRFVENHDFCKMVEELTDLHERIITSNKIPRDTSRSSKLISRLREKLPKTNETTVTSLAEIREWSK